MPCQATRLLDPLRPLPLAEHLAAGGYPDLPAGDVLAVAAASGLRGRGGAGFPLARKLAAVAASPDPYWVVVANGEEGEPGSVKDRALLRHRPHLVLDGLSLASTAVGADEAHVYVSDPRAGAAVDAALVERPLWLPVRVTVVSPTYVAGEESAVVRRLDGGPALPTAKPPRAHEQGVGGHPTAVCNVETLAHLARACAVPAATEADPSGADAGTVLVTLAGDRVVAGLHEVPLGSTLRALLPARLDARAVLAGGMFGGLAGPEILDLPLEHEPMAAAGTALGCAAFHLVGPAGCPVEVVTDAVSYLARESSRQCGSCLKGTAVMASTLRRLAAGAAAPADLDALGRWSTRLRGRGNCALLDAACLVLASLLARWRDDVDRHVGTDTGAPGRCACRRRRDGFVTTRLTVAVPDPLTRTLADPPAAPAPATLGSTA